MSSTSIHEKIERLGFNGVYMEFLSHSSLGIDLKKVELLFGSSQALILALSGFFLLFFRRIFFTLAFRFLPLIALAVIAAGIYSTHKDSANVAAFSSGFNWQALFKNDTVIVGLGCFAGLVVLSLAFRFLGLGLAIVNRFLPEPFRYVSSGSMAQPQVAQPVVQPIIVYLPSNMPQNQVPAQNNAPKSAVLPH